MSPVMIGLNLTDWEKAKIRENKGHALGVLLAMCVDGKILEDVEGDEDELGCRDGLDGIAMGAGCEREELEAGLWCLDRLGWARKHGKFWRKTQDAPLLSVDSDIPIARRQQKIAFDRLMEATA